MKFLVLLPLFAALLVTSCGEKSSSEGSDSAGASAEPSADATQETEKPLPLPLSDADVERLLKEAVDFESLEERDGLFYQDNTPYSGWVKSMYDSGQAEALAKIKDGNATLGTQWQENGRKKEEGTFKDGERDGTFTVWHENGQKEEEGTYKDGERDGLWTWWHENGEKRSEGAFKESVADGRWTDWYTSGQKWGVGTFKDGKRNSLWTEWYINGQKRSEGSFKEGVEDGLWTEWHESGQKRAEVTYKDGQLLSRKNWNRRGEEVETAAEATVLSDAEVERLLDEAVDAKSLEWRWNDFCYEDNKPYSGWVKVLYDSGQVRLLRRYEDGKAVSLFTEWHDNGQKKGVGPFKNGKKNGLWTWWHDNGQKLAERTYKDGEEVSKKYWNSKGEEVETEEESKN